MRSASLRFLRLAAQAAGSGAVATEAALSSAALLAASRRTSLQALRALASTAAGSAAVADALKPKMMCFQCEQTANGTGCTVIGQCGKTPEVAGLQDLLVFSLKGLGTLAHHARTTAGIHDPEIDSFLLRASFSTLTNVNFDDTRFHQYISECLALHKRLSDKLAAGGHPAPALPQSAGTPWFEDATGHPLAWNAQNVGKTFAMGELLDLSKKTGIVTRQELLGKTTAGLQELIMYGLKGVCAYAAHAEALGGTSQEVYAEVQKCFAFLSSPEASDVGQLLGQALHLGAVNFKVMELLHQAHASNFGKPEPTEVSLVPKPGKAILITGHDMHDLHELLKQTEGTGINVYTHGEMLPGHAYPGLKKYPHLAGHYGGAWYQQKKDFAGFPGAVLATTNCVLEPMALYRKNLFTTNETGLANVTHCPNKDFSAVIKRAQELPGWTERNMPRTSSASSSGGRGAVASTAPSATVKSVTTGFGHDAVLGVAGAVIEAVKEGKLKHIVLMGGCDGHEPARAYYGQLGNKLSTDVMMLTLGCAKFRVNQIPELQTNIPGTPLPRLLDMGQCNDAYSALVVATELAKAFKTDVNSLPLSLDISWFEQKAVAVLLTLLHLGVKNIRLGPALPAFLTPEALQVLVDKFQIKPADTTNPELDLIKMMNKQ